MILPHFTYEKPNKNKRRVTRSEQAEVPPGTYIKPTDSVLRAYGRAAALGKDINAHLPSTTRYSHGAACPCPCRLGSCSIFQVAVTHTPHTRISLIILGGFHNSQTQIRIHFLLFKTIASCQYQTIMRLHYLRNFEIIPPYYTLTSSMPENLHKK